MNPISATVARQRWAETLDASRHEPVSITSHARTVAVVMDPDFARRALEALEVLKHIH
ncbi:MULTISPECIES: type II toxin-antitoxin system prevent-host-death family antitoxin [Arthrobacter]|uniref:type II toxin-antitoxin system prevent-host-death family antitoxin n=1 Tax=Arthrobacter TaxID=1663 RepID=UPI000B274C6A|nr:MULTISPECIES: type II toxin-antitoxin system prevent-host-death family antitoxin [Arthrobacter]